MCLWWGCEVKLFVGPREMEEDTLAVWLRTRANVSVRILDHVVEALAVQEVFEVSDLPHLRSRWA